MNAGGSHDEPLRRALERMAHQIKNPLQAVAMNLEVVRSRVRGEAPEAWEAVERFAAAVDANVELLDRRLRLLLALGRRNGDEEPGEVDLAALTRDFAAALRFDQEPPGVRVRGTSGLRARARQGWLLALLLEVWSAAAAEGATETEVTVSEDASGVRLGVELPPAALGVAGSWEELAERAGAALEVRAAGAETRLLLDFPPVGRSGGLGTTEPSAR